MERLVSEMFDRIPQPLQSTLNQTCSHTCQAPRHWYGSSALRTTQSKANTRVKPRTPDMQRLRLLIPRR
eukprot:507407-Rhodomonas_salina.3